jgi:hypothetical protein
MSKEGLKIENNLIIKLNKFRGIDDINKLFIEGIFVMILFILNIIIEMSSKSFDLIPDGIELFEIIFEYFIL